MSILTSVSSAMAMKAIDARLKRVERLLVLGRAEALRHLVIVAGAQICVRGRKAVLAFVEFLGMRAHAVGDFDARVEPRLVVFADFPFSSAPILCNSPMSEPPYGPEPSMLMNPADQR